MAKHRRLPLKGSDLGEHLRFVMRNDPYYYLEHSYAADVKTLNVKYQKAGSFAKAKQFIPKKGEKLIYIHTHPYAPLSSMHTSLLKRIKKKPAIYKFYKDDRNMLLRPSILDVYVWSTHERSFDRNAIHGVASRVRVNGRVRYGVRTFDFRTLSSRQKTTLRASVKRLVSASRVASSLRALELEYRFYKSKPYATLTTAQRLAYL